MPIPRRPRRKAPARISRTNAAPRGLPLWWMPVVAIAIVVAAAVIYKQDPRQRESAPSTLAEARRGPPPGHPSITIHGVARVLDGDTIVVSGKRIRLEGIDAPEGKQPCYVNNRAWACGTASTDELRRFIGGSPVGCASSGTDRYGRTLARCHVHGTDIQSWMVINGWAVAYSRYSTDYEPEQEYARARRLGIWRGQVEMPEDWRRSQRR